MRILKIILIVLAVIIGLYLLISLFLPSNYEVSRIININSAKRPVFAQVNDFRNWEAWSPWQAKDSTMVVRYTSDTEGEGANFSWTTDQSKDGNMQIVSVSGMDTILTKLNFEGDDPVDGYWYFSSAGEGLTEVT